MLLSVNQIQDLLHVIENNTNVFIAKHIGSDYLTTEEKRKLADIGINSYNLYDKNSDLITQSFHFGLISDALGIDASKITFEELKEYFNKGKHIPLTKVEQHALDSVKKQSFNDIKANQGRIFNDVNNVISNAEKNNRSAYESIIRKEVEKGIIDRKTTDEIARELGRITNDWSRNFTKSIHYISHYAFNEGRLSAIQRKDDENIKCYFDVYAGACISCVRLYLSNGVGSKPKIFSVKQLKKNGSNIGRKVKEWLPTISPTHVFCRCTINILKPGYDWNNEKKRFEIIKKIEIKNRLPIRFTVKIGTSEKDYFI